MTRFRLFGRRCRCWRRRPRTRWTRRIQLRRKRTRQHLRYLPLIPLLVHSIFEPVLVVHHEYILPPPHAEHHCCGFEFFAAHVAQAVGVAGGEAEDLEVVVEGGVGEGLKGGREEHGFVVGVGGEEDDALVGEEGGGWGGGEGGGEVPESEEEEGKGEEED